jgi:hypothetical protein
MTERRNGLVLRHRRPSAGAPAAWPLDPAFPLAVQSLVVAARDIREGFKLAPCGAVGVVTHVFAHGVGYEVRFSEPSRVTLCASRDELKLA